MYVYIPYMYKFIESDGIVALKCMMLSILIIVLGSHD